MKQEGFMAIELMSRFNLWNLIVVKDMFLNNAESAEQVCQKKNWNSNSEKVETRVKVKRARFIKSFSKNKYLNLMTTWLDFR